MNTSGLESGPALSFADWPSSDVPSAAAGVYTIWENSEFVYVGMAGRGKTAKEIAQARKSGRRTGLWGRLNSHASGRRSGDQFCVYVCDRLVLPTLTAEQIRRIGAGELLLDSLTRIHIRERFSYRWAETPDGNAAFALERLVQQGALKAGRPFLNPSG